MQEKLKNQFTNLRDRWNHLERSQKIKLALTVAALMVILWITIFLATRPKTVVLFANQSASTIGAIQNALDKEGIYNKPVRNGTAIEVQEKDVPAAQISIEMNNVLTGGAFTYEDALNASGMGTTETVKLENFKRLKESDLAATLRMFDGVRDARVSLVTPKDDNFFLRSQEKSSASVFVEASRDIDKTQAEAMARLVMRSVKGLTMDDISIIDQNGNQLYSPIEMDAFSSVSNEYEMELLRKQEVDAKVRQALAPLYDNVQAIYNLVLNWDRSQQSSVTYTPPVTGETSGLPSTERIERESVETSDDAAEPGLAANNMVPNYQFGGGGTSTASVNNRESNFLYNEERMNVETSLGSVAKDDSSIAVLVYRYKYHDQKVLMDNGNLDNLTWEAYKEQNSDEEALIIPEGVVDALKAGTGINNLQIVGYSVPVFVDYEAPPTRIEQIIIFAILALLILLLAWGLIRKTQPDEITEVEPELSVEDLLVSTQLEEQRESEAEKLQAIDFGKDSEVKKQIEKFVNEKPEAVGQLLRNWLNNDWE